MSAYESTVDVLNGVWEPFGKQASKFFAAMGNGVIPVLGRISSAESRKLFTDLWKTLGDKASLVMDAPGYNPLEDGLGVWAVWSDDAAQERARELAPKFGLSIDPTRPNLVEPMGLRAEPTPFQVPDVDTSKYRRPTRNQTRFGAINDVFESIYGGVFYDPEWVPESKGDDEILVRGDVENPELLALQGPEPANRRLAAEYPEAMMFHKDYRFEDVEWSDDYAGGLVDELATAIKMQESDGDYRAENQWETRHGAYQFSDWLWGELSTEYNETVLGGSGPLEWKNNPDNQDAVAKWEIERLLERFNGDIGAVAAEWIAGRNNVYDYYMQGIDWRDPGWDPEHPTMMEYVSQVVRSWWNMKRGNPYTPPEDLEPIYKLDDEDRPIRTKERGQ